MAKKTRNVGICVYCGRHGPLTKDHIPPKSLFPKPQPSNLITVPCCKGCNRLAQKDDEYFRMMVVLREDAGQHTEARRTWETVSRSLQRPEAGGLRASLLHSLRPVDLRTASGVYVGQRLGVNVDLERIERVTKRIVKGLFFTEIGRRLPDTYEAAAMTPPQFLPGEESMASLGSVLAALRAQPVREIGEGVFSYRFVVTEDQPDATVWLLCFFEGLWTIGVTLPLNRSDGNGMGWHSG